MRERTLFLIVFIPVCLYFACIAKMSRGDFLSAQRDKTDLYNHLTRALMAGQAELLIKPRPELVALPNPYDARYGRPYQLHDASLYKGKYYVYFGLTPVVTLLIPFRLLTRMDLSVAMATLIFAILGYAMACALFRALIQSIAQTVPAWLKMGGYLALGMCVFLPFALKTANCYELATMSAYCFFIAGSYFLLVAMRGTKQRAPMFALAGLCYGLSVGGRPNYALGVILVVALAACAAFRIVKSLELSVRDLVSFATPIVLTGIALAAYNYARFESPFDFGFKYQLHDGRVMNHLHFHPLNLVYGTFYQIFSVPDVSRSFPFVHAQIQRLWSSDYTPPEMSSDPMFGMIAAMPIALLALLPFPGWLAWRKLSANRGPERFTVVAVMLIGAANFLVITAMGIYCLRYCGDFAPSLVLVGFVSLAFWLNDSARRHRKLIAVACSATILLCAAECGLVGLNGGNATDTTFLAHPKLYFRLISLFNHITRGQTPSPSVAEDLNATITFSGTNTPLMEPILTNGHSGMTTWVGVIFPEPGQAQFYYQHLPTLADYGKAVAVVPGKPYALHVRLDPDTSFLTIELDQEVVYQRRVPMYPVQLNDITVGQNPVWSPYRARDFNGKLEVKNLVVRPSSVWRALEPDVPSIAMP